jgi:GDP-L-fucose synthase
MPRLSGKTRILVTGAAGMVGGALVKTLRESGAANVIPVTKSDVDLRSASAVQAFFASAKPEIVFNCAARVGGIAANIADPAAFLSDNVKIAVNVLEASAAHGVTKGIFLGSSCIYPRDCPQPIKEEYLLTGPLEPTNEGYALAKIAGIRLAQYLWRQTGLRTISPIPCSIYGTGDDFDLERCHVLAALVRRFVDAQATGSPTVVLWGTGAARREFMHVADAVKALVFLLERYESPEIINLGPGTDVSIAELAALVAAEAGYSGEIVWDSRKPDGMPRKCLDVTQLERLGFRPSISLREGIKRTVGEYRARAREVQRPQTC